MYWVDVKKNKKKWYIEIPTTIKKQNTNKNKLNSQIFILAGSKRGFASVTVFTLL